MMPTAAPFPAAPERGARCGLLRRFVIDPVVQQLRQGVTPEQIARTVAVGTACSLLPFLGFTSLLNLIVGCALRMNQPLLQALNQVLGPVQLMLILVHVRIGEAMWRAQDSAFRVSDMLQVFREKTFGEFLERFGWAGLHALTGWLVTAPVMVAAVYIAVRPLLRRFVREESA